MTIRASSRAASERFYETVLRALGVDQSYPGEQYAEWDDFSLSQASGERPPTRRLHVAVVAPSRSHVDAFWRVGTEAGYRDDGAPGPRPQYSAGYYGAFLLDPDGNSAEAVHHGEPRTGRIDHLWIRVSDLGAARRFYETVAPQTGFRLEHARPDRATFVGSSASFSVVPGAPTEHVHMAFGARENAVVDDFHRAATKAGYRDNGAPGERPIYHAGYYAAFVLDPDSLSALVIQGVRGGSKSSKVESATHGGPGLHRPPHAPSP